MKNIEKDQSELVERIKEQAELLFNTMREAEKHNLRVYLDFGSERTKPEIVVTKVLFSQGQYSVL